MTTYRLHYFPESGASYKLALMLTLCGQEFELVWTDFAGGATRTEEWRRTINPMGEIPFSKKTGNDLPKPLRSSFDSPIDTAGLGEQTIESDRKSCDGCSGTTTS